MFAAKHLGKLHFPTDIDTLNRFIIISGCSGGGKSTLLAELRRRGYAVLEEPGRRIVKEQTSRGGTALPWLDMEAFLRRAIKLALDDYVAERADFVLDTLTGH